MENQYGQEIADINVSVEKHPTITYEALL
jgi:hypothetical protein